MGPMKRIGGKRRRRGLGSFRNSVFEKFRKFSGKGIDGGVAEVLAETLSLNGKLFEIYFVRLIGTPNQQFKKRYWFRPVSC